MRTLRFLIIAALLAPPLTSSAQTVERTIDLSAFGWGRVYAHPVDTDGTPLTEEWAVQHQDTQHWRVIAVRGGGLCIGPWFDPRPSAMYGVSIGTVAGRSKLLVAPAFTSATLTIVSLQTPGC
jgi:hypothetical protein